MEIKNSISTVELDRFNMRFRRDLAKRQEESLESILDENEYELENENSDKPKVKRDKNMSHVQELQNGVKALNFDLK